MKPVPKKLDPAKMFIHAVGFIHATNILSDQKITDDQILHAIASPVMVLQALSCELMLKCLICIEISIVPKEHHLKHLFDRLSPALRKRIITLWDTTVAPIREPLWKRMDSSFPEKVARDLPTILSNGNRAFEQLRYSYEGHPDLEFHAGAEIPKLLVDVILELKPEYRGLRYQTQPTSPNR